MTCGRTRCTLPDVLPTFLESPSLPLPHGATLRGPLSTAAPYTLNIVLYRVDSTYRLEISHDDPTSQGRSTTLRGEAALAPLELLPLQLDSDAYGRQLSAQVFADPKVKARFVEVDRVAQAGSRPLRLSLTIDPSAAELHALRWELLRHPETHHALTTSEHILFSRFMESDDWRPVLLRARTDLVALVAISAPEGPKFRGFKNGSLAPVRIQEELASSRAALAGLTLQVAGGKGDPLTLDRLIDALHRGVDLVYLVCHGSFHRQTGPVLFLQDSDGDMLPVDGNALATRLSELQTGPRLIVLASCQSAGDGGTALPDERSSPHATLAGRLASAGVPAVLAMQGNIHMDTVKEMMPVFFRELLVDGQIDRALALARGRVRNRSDHWMPALFSRLRDGKLWYTAAFRGVDGADQGRTWKRLLPNVRLGQIVPILGPEVGAAVFGMPAELARKMAVGNRFPLSASDRRDLPRVSQFIHVDQSRVNLVAEYRSFLTQQILKLHPRLRPAPGQRVPELESLWEPVAAQVRQDPADPHLLLATLQAPIYITTCFDPLLELALQAANRRPLSVPGRWRHNRAPVPPERELAPTPAAPVVYHILGALTDPTSLVLTEDDTFDMMMATTAGKLTPTCIEGTLVASSLLILGFRLTDWSFRVLFRLLMSLGGSPQFRENCHVAVQLDPDLDSVADVLAAKKYLADYFGHAANIEIYWGSTRDFLSALKRELEREAGGAVDPEVTSTTPAGMGGWEEDDYS